MTTSLQSGGSEWAMSLLALAPPYDAPRTTTVRVGALVDDDRTGTLLGGVKVIVREIG